MSSRPAVDGPRACTEADLEDALALINGVFREGTDQDVRTDYPLVYHPSARHLQRIIRVDGELVAHVPVAPRGVIAEGDAFTAGLISATVTHPDHRHHGYATACLMSCVETMDEEGWPVSVLWTLERTFPFYQQAGFEAVASQGWVYTLGPGDFDAVQGGRFGAVEYDAADPDHLDAIMEMHEAEPLRIARSRSDYETLFSLPKVYTFLATDGGGIVGYLVYGESSNKPGLIEAGGPVEAVEALAAHVVRSVGRDIQAITPLTPTALGAICGARAPGTRQPVEKAAGVGNQMHRINSLEGLLRSIRGHLGAKSEGRTGQVSLVCTDSGEAVTLDFADGEAEVSAGACAEPIALTRRELTRLVFGSHPVIGPLDVGGPGAGPSTSPGQALLNLVFPYYFPIWELDHC